MEKQVLECWRKNMQLQPRHARGCNAFLGGGICCWGAEVRCSQSGGEGVWQDRESVRTGSELIPRLLLSKCALSSSAKHLMA